MVGDLDRQTGCRCRARTSVPAFFDTADVEDLAVAAGFWIMVWRRRWLICDGWTQASAHGSVPAWR